MLTDSAFSKDDPVLENLSKFATFHTIISSASLHFTLITLLHSIPRDLLHWHIGIVLQHHIVVDCAEMVRSQHRFSRVASKDRLKAASLKDCSNKCSRETYCNTFSFRSVHLLNSNVQYLTWLQQL